MSLRSFIRPFWLAGALLMMLDGLTTYIALTTVDGAREANPLMNNVIGLIGLELMCALKVIVGVACCWRLAVISERGHRYDWMNRSLLFRPKPKETVQRNAAWALSFTVTIMGIVVGNNLAQISA